MSLNDRIPKILVVDDNKEIRKLIKDIIECHFEASVVEAQDGVDANWKMTNEEIDILITDLKMPRVSGIELIVSLKKNLAIYQPKYVIIISGAVDDKLARIFSDKGLKTVTKPIHTADFVDFLTSTGLRRIDQETDLSSALSNNKKRLYQKKTG